MVLNHDFLEVSPIRGLGLSIYTLDQVLIPPAIACYCEQSTIILWVWFFHFRRGSLRSVSLEAKFEVEADMQVIHRIFIALGRSL